YKLSALWHGTNGASWHLDNIALHVLTSVLVWGLARAVRAGWWAAACAGLFFALAPAHAETVAWITGRVDAFPTLAYLAAFLLFVRFRRTGSKAARVLSVACLGAGLLFKEV